MAKTILQDLLIEKIHLLKYAFQTTAKDVFVNPETGKLRHSGEFGMYREDLVKEFLRVIIPQTFDIGDGFLINGHGDVSQQCDIIIYDKAVTPLIENSRKQTFFPIESVVAVGEIKSNLDRSKFKEAINKLAEKKTVALGLVDTPTVIKRTPDAPFCPNHSYNPFDHIISFLICNKISFQEPYTENMDNYYDENILKHCRHNLILSLDDGLLTYKDENGINLCMPVENHNFQHTHIDHHDNNDAHILEFSRLLFGNISMMSIFLPDLFNYLEYDMNNILFVPKAEERNNNEN